MKIVIPGGTGQLGQVLRADFDRAGDEVVVLTRKPKAAGEIYWDAKTQGDWVAALAGADVVINLAGRTVNCRYTKENLKQMMDSRVDSTRAVGEAIQHVRNPPKVWLQMSTATIYQHTFGEANDEAPGVIGGNEPGVPPYWAYSVEIAKNWEAEQANAATPQTRKVAMRTAMVMAPRGACADWPACNQMDGRDRRVGFAHRHGAALEKPPRGAGPAAERRLYLRLSGLGRSRQRPDSAYLKIDEL